MKTLQELLCACDKAPSRSQTRAPHPLALKQSGAKVIESVVMSDGTTIEVYDNGYVCYSNSLHFSVFGLHERCREYGVVLKRAWKEMGVKAGEEDFLNMPWPAPLMLIGEDNFLHNQQTGDVGDVVSYSAVSEEWSVLGDWTYEALNYMLLREQERAVDFLMKILPETLQSLGSCREYVLRQIFYEGRKGKDLAAELGMTPQGISILKVRSLRTMRKMMEEQLQKMEEDKG